MKKLKLIIIISVVFCSFNLFAGGKEIGNGADGVVCFYQTDGSKDFATKDKVDSILLANRVNVTENDPLREVNFNNITVELFDLYLKRQPTLAGEKKIITSNLPFKDIISEIRDRILHKSSFAYQIDELQSELPYENFKGINSSVKPVDDSEHVNLDEAHCSFLQLAIRHKAGKELKVTYDRRLFNKMNFVNQAAFLFHEWLYLYAVNKRYHNNSISTREVIGLIFSDEFDSMTGEDFHKILLKQNFISEYDIESKEIQVAEAVRLQGQSILAFDVHIIEWIDGQRYLHFMPIYPLDFALEEMELKLKGAVLLFPDNKLRSGYLVEPVTLHGIPLSKEERFNLYASGAIEDAHISEVIQIEDFKLKAKTKLSLYENGKLWLGTLDEAKYFSDINAVLPENSTILLSEHGELQKFILGNETNFFGTTWPKGQAFKFEESSWKATTQGNIELGYYSFPRETEMEFSLSGNLKYINVKPLPRLDVIIGSSDEFRYFEPSNTLRCEQAFFYPENILKTCYPYGYSLHNGNVINDTWAYNYKPWVQINNEIINLYNGKEIQFYENGNFKSAWIFGIQRIIGSDKTCGIDRKATLVEYYNNGQIKSCVVTKKSFRGKTSYYKYSYSSKGKIVSKEIIYK